MSIKIYQQHEWRFSGFSQAASAPEKHEVSAQCWRALSKTICMMDCENPRFLKSLTWINQHWIFDSPLELHFLIQEMSEVVLATPTHRPWQPQQRRRRPPLPSLMPGTAQVDWMRCRQTLHNYAGIMTKVASNKPYNHWTQTIANEYMRLGHIFGCGWTNTYECIQWHAHAYVSACMCDVMKCHA